MNQAGDTFTLLQMVLLDEVATLLKQLHVARTL
jgi:hypothetical protein